MDVMFNQVKIGSKELEYVAKALESGRISGDGPFTKRCHALLETIYGSSVFLMHSCTAALEAAVILAGIEPGDEVVMPSYTFVSTANAVVMRGGVPVFVDVRRDTLNIDETLIEAAITPKTRAIMPVHYAGVGAGMTAICELAQKHGLTVIEDAAQGFGSTWEGKPLGSLGALGCLSFHETKNIVSGEGGALIVNAPDLVDRAQFIREKGTNRTQFLRREITKYEWVDIGSSYLPSDILAAVLLAQLEKSEDINNRRLEIWQKYRSALASLEESGGFQLPAIPQAARHNGHIFHIIAREHAVQRSMLEGLRADGVAATPHYVPLHDSVAGRKFSRVSGALDVTNHVAARLFRLPLHARMSDEQVDFVISRTLARARQFVHGVET